jgi:tetratricopeptide (TPR) repeat protein
VPGKQAGRVSQQVTAGRDANVAGRDQFIINVTVAGAREPMVPGLLPRDAPDFTGREGELDRLTGLAGGGSVAVATIGGTAGVGKTALAVHAAHRLLPHFPDGHLYADLRGFTAGQAAAGPGEVLEVFLRHLGVAGEEMPVTVEERSGMLRQLLAARRVLMVLDNAAAEAQVRPLLPGTGGSLVIVTSRSALPGLEADDRINLDVLSRAEAAGLLARLAGAERAAADPAEVAEVARLCGRLPLALRIAGQLLAAHSSWPVAKLAGMLAGEQDRLARLAAGDLQVRAAFEVSYAQLPCGDAQVFRLLGLNPGPEFTVAAAASLAGINNEEARRVLDRLAEAHLVTEDATGRFGMHDLLRLFARETCEEADGQADRDAAEVRLVGHYVDLAGFLGSCVDPRGRSAAEQAGAPLPAMREALARFAVERPSLLAVLRLAAQRGWDDQVQRLAESMAESLRVLRYLDDLRAVHEAALDTARRAGDTPAAGTALNNLGEAYRALRRPGEAVGCYQQAVAICREIGDRLGEGQTLCNLGNAYAELRRLGEAVGCHQQALAICRETGDRYSEGQTLKNLGTDYAELRRFDEAVGCYQQALAICRETGDRLGEGQTLGNLGNAYQGLRRFGEAVGCYQQALTICRETGNRFGEGQTLGNLGVAYQAIRQPDRAATCWREAAAAMRDAGDHEKARRLEEQAANAGPGPRRWRRRS